MAESEQLTYAPVLHALITNTPITNFEQPKAAQQTISKEGSTNSKEHSGALAVIPFHGAMIKEDEPCGATGTDTLAQMIREADANPNYTAILIDFNTPGGAANSVLEPSMAIREAQKPVIGFVKSGMIASAGYWIACHCDELYAVDELDQVGSIGTYVSIMDYKKMYKEKFGIDIIEVYATKSTNKNKLFNDALTQEPEAIEALRTNYVDKFNNAFLAKVQQNRPGINNEVLSGETYFADQAVTLGLIDGIKPMNEIIDRAFELGSKTSTNFNSNTMKVNATHVALMAALNITLEADAQEVDVVVTDDHAEQLNTALANANSAREVAEASLTEQQDLVAQHAATIATLQAELKKRPAPATPKQVDHNPDGGGETEFNIDRHLPAHYKKNK